MARRQLPSHAFHLETETPFDFSRFQNMADEARLHATDAIEAAFGAHRWRQADTTTDAADTTADPLADLLDSSPYDSGLSGAGAKPTGAGGGKGRTKTTTDTTTDTTTGSTGTDTSGSTGSTTGSTTTTTAVKSDYTSGLDTPDGFNIQLVFSGTGWTETLKQAFYDATETLSDIITGDLADAVTASGVIDDILVSATLTSIDGAGGYAGWGGTSALRSGSYIPSQGYMKFDTADVDSLVSKGIFDDVVLHEMLHALGFGTTWNAMGLVTNYNGDLRFNGDYATNAYNALYPTIAAADALSDFGVPVETDGGSGTAGVHWDDATFGKEIMTGYMGGTNYLTDMTIAAFQDMGYDTIIADNPLYA